MLLGGTSRPGNWRGEGEQAGVAGCGWFDDKTQSAQPAGTGQWTGLGYSNKAEGLGGGEGNFETRAAGLLRRAYRGDMMRSEDAVFSFFATVGAGWRCFGDAGCWLLLAAPRLGRANRLSLFYPFESFVQAANHHGTE